VGQAGTGSSGDRSHRRHTHGGQWQSRVSLRYQHQPGKRSPDHPIQDSQWQVAERRYLSETSMTLVLANATVPDHADLKETPKLTRP